MFIIIEFLIFIGLIYWGAQVAEIEHADFWRSFVIAVVAIIISAISSFVLFPLMVVPLLGSLVGLGIMVGSVTLASKVLLSIDWKPAITIGIFVGVANLIMDFLFSGCSFR